MRAIPSSKPNPARGTNRSWSRPPRYFGGRYWLWYSGYRNPLQPTTSIAIGVATSDDGMHWTPYAKNPVIKPGPAGSWNDLRILAPDVIVEPDGSLLMVSLWLVAKGHRQASGIHRVLALQEVSLRPAWRNIA